MASFSSGRTSGGGGTVVGPSIIKRVEVKKTEPAAILDSFELTEEITQVSALKSFWGLPIPLSSGTRLITGVPLWIGDKRGDLISFAVGLGYRTNPEGSGEKTIISKIWANEELIVDRTGQGLPAARGLRFKLYNGSETQTQDGTILADQGPLKTPAFRGMIYVVFTDFDLGERDLFEVPVIRVEFTDRSSYQPEVKVFGASPVTTELALFNINAFAGQPTWQNNTTVIANNINRVYQVLTRLNNNTGKHENRVICWNTVTGDVVFDGQITNVDGTVVGQQFTSVQYFSGMNCLLAYTNGSQGNLFIINVSTLRAYGVAGVNPTLGAIHYFYEPLAGMKMSFYETGEEFPAEEGLYTGPNPQGLRPERNLKIQHGFVLMTPTSPYYGSRAFLVHIIRYSDGFILLCSVKAVSLGPTSNGHSTAPVIITPAPGLAGGNTWTGAVGTTQYSFIMTTKANAYLLSMRDTSAYNAMAYLIPSIAPTYPGGQGIVATEYDSYGGNLRLADRSGYVFNDVTVWNCYVKESRVQIRYNDGSIGGGRYSLLHEIGTPSKIGHLANDLGSNLLSDDSAGFDITLGSYANIRGQITGTMQMYLLEVSSPEPTELIQLDEVTVQGSDLDLSTFINPVYVGATNVNITFCKPAWSSTLNCFFIYTLPLGMVQVFPYGGSGSLQLDDFLYWISLRAGFEPSDISITGINDTIWGSIINADVDFWTLVTDLSQVYDFDVFESEGKIKFSRNLQLDNPIISFDVTTDDLAPISSEDFGSDSTSPSLKVRRIGENSLPSEVKINYIDYTQDYRVASSYARRMKFPRKLTQSDQTLELSVPICMNPTEVLTRATRVLYDSWSDRSTYEWRMPTANILLEPSDYVKIEEIEQVGPDTITIEHVIKITSVTTNADWSLSLTGNQFYSKQRTEITINPPERETPIIEGPSSGALILFDVPLLRSEDFLDEGSVIVPLLFIDRSYGQLKYVDHFIQADTGVYTYITRNDTQTVFGRSSTILPLTTTAFAIDDELQIRVFLEKGLSTDIAQPTYDEFLSGKYLVAIGNTGRWELISYRDVTIVGNQVVLSGIIRGRRGTEANVGLHETGDYVVFVDKAQITLMNAVPEQVPAEVTIKNLGYKQSEFQATFETFTINANYNKPFAPTNLQAEYSGDDVVLTWVRRTRQTSTMTNGTSVTPYFGELESYDLVILDEDNEVIREVLGLTSPTFTYTDAMRAEDNNLGDVIIFSVSQKASLEGVGQGFWSLVYPIDIR